jgi:hypothetical protein
LIGFDGLSAQSERDKGSPKNRNLSASTQFRPLLSQEFVSFNVVAVHMTKKVAHPIGSTQFSAGI